jgi:hypothetical protein
MIMNILISFLSLETRVESFELFIKKMSTNSTDSSGSGLNMVVEIRCAEHETSSMCNS